MLPLAPLVRFQVAVLLFSLIAFPASAMDGKKSMGVGVGDIMIEDAFTRATVPNQKAGGGFLMLTNKGAVDDVLMSASAEFAGRVEVHEMKMDGDVMKMRALSDGLQVPAGESVQLQPGGLHLMFMEMSDSLSEGDMVTVTLQFKLSGSVEVPFMVGSRDAKTAMNHNH